MSYRDEAELPLVKALEEGTSMEGRWRETWLEKGETAYAACRWPILSSVWPRSPSHTGMTAGEKLEGLLCRVHDAAAAEEEGPSEEDLALFRYILRP